MFRLRRSRRASPPAEAAGKPVDAASGSGPAGTDMDMDKDAQPARPGSPSPRKQQQRRNKPAFEAAVECDSRERRREGLHSQNAADDALVVSEKKPAQRGELVVVLAYGSSKLDEELTVDNPRR